MHGEIDFLWSIARPREAFFHVVACTQSNQEDLSNCLSPAHIDRDLNHQTVELDPG
ncbi:hypothetical protein X989_5619 [Burkholderia pseudomallei MSHR4378]|nr:hypothetical protein X989_5619 [Burkholderia pseudomallei MSHR4378]